MASNAKWKTRKWRASMCDVAESTAHVVDKTTGKPYETTVTLNYRDNGKKDYRIIIQFLSPDEVRGCWYVSTGFYEDGEFKDPKAVIAKAERALNRLVKDGSPISYDDYFDWEDNHPIMKHRRLASDYGLYVVAPDKTTRGWFDRRYGTITQSNKYATRFSSKEAAEEEAAKWARSNPKFTFTAKQMGKLDD